MTCDMLPIFFNQQFPPLLTLAWVQHQQRSAHSLLHSQPLWNPRSPRICLLPWSLFLSCYQTYPLSWHWLCFASWTFLLSLGWRMSSNPRAWLRFTLESRAIKTATAKEKEPCALSRMNDGKGSLANQNILLPSTFQAHSISTWWQFCESNVDR